jgi:hypothetical protein
MGVETTVLELVSIFREIQAQLDELSEMNRVHIRQTAGCCLSRLTGMELTHPSAQRPMKSGTGRSIIATAPMLVALH